MIQRTDKRMLFICGFVIGERLTNKRSF